MDLLEDEYPPAPGSTTVVVVTEEPPAKAQPVRENGQLNTFAKSILSKRKEVEAPMEVDKEQYPVLREPATRNTGRKSQVRLPRNKSLYAMRDLQRSNKPIFKNLTMHRTVKMVTRKILDRPDVKYTKEAMRALMRIVESMLYEQLLKAQAFCLNAGRKTLMQHHLETAEHHHTQPDLTHWTVEDFTAEESRLEPSRFPKSRLSQNAIK